LTPQYGRRDPPSKEKAKAVETAKKLPAKIQEIVTGMTKKILSSTWTSK